MSSKLVFVSGNQGKRREVEAILGTQVDTIALDLPEIQSLDVVEVVRVKSLTAFANVSSPVLVEDTGLSLDHLHGLPGPLVKWFLGTVGPEGICALIPPGAPREATARTAVAVCDGKAVELFVGETRGLITEAPRGQHGFGWDSIFVPAGATLTFAEMAESEKHTYSMRRIALQRLRDAVGTRIQPE